MNNVMRYPCSHKQTPQQIFVDYLYIKHSSSDSYKAYKVVSLMTERTYRSFRFRIFQM